MKDPRLTGETESNQQERKIRARWGSLTCPTLAENSMKWGEGVAHCAAVWVDLVQIDGIDQTKAAVY